MDNTSAASKPADRDVRDPAQRGALALGVYAIAIALIASLLYIGTAAMRISVTDRFADVPRDVLWMSPVSSFIWFGLAWIAVTVVARFIRAEKGFEIGLWLLFALFGFSQMLAFTAIHRVAALLLAAGLATAVLRMQQRSPGKWLRGARRTRNALALGFVGANVVAVAGSSLAGARATRNLTDAPPGSPDVILLVLDTMRGDVLQAAGSSRRVMPFLDSLAASAAFFPYAFATSSWTLPSHGSMFTGEYPGALNTSTTEPLEDAYRTLGEQFASSGYYTVGVTGNLHYTNWESGINQGFLEWHDYQRSPRQLLRSSLIGRIQMLVEIADASSWQDVVDAVRRHDIMVYPKPDQDAPVASQITDRFLSWHHRRPARPYFAFLNYFDAHAPYRPPIQYRTRFAETPTDRDLYDGELAYIDDELRRLFAELHRRRGLENTYVVITSDHGEHFGGHGQLEHGETLYNAVLRVPLVIVGPAVAGKRVERAVTLRDLPITVLQLANLQEDFPGEPLTGHLTDSAFRSSPVLASLGTGAEAVRAYVDDEFHLVQRPDGEELYRYRSDPRELADLAQVDSLKPQLVRLRQEMLLAIERHVRASHSGADSRR
jgi:arylsulfatase A-like enzyme